MQSLILTLHIIVCVLLVILILLQSGKEGMGVIFGGGNSSVFGSAGAGGILAKLTTLMAIIFIITSLSYTYVTSSRPTTESVILDVHIEEPAKPAQDQSAQPAQPAPPVNTPAVDAVKPGPDSQNVQENSQPKLEPAQNSGQATEPARENPPAK